MNKEREFLIKFCSNEWTFSDVLLLQAEAEELLAKSEHNEEFYGMTDE